MKSEPDLVHKILTPKPEQDPDFGSLSMGNVNKNVDIKICHFSYHLYTSMNSSQFWVAFVLLNIHFSVSCVVQAFIIITWHPPPKKASREHALSTWSPGQLGGMNSINRHIYPLKIIYARTNILNNSHRSQD